MAQMSEAELRAIVDGEMRQAVGYWSGTLANQRQKAMQFYLGEAKGELAPPEIEGRSAVISPDVRNTIEAMLPQLMVKFAGTERPVEFLPRKPGDEKKAEQATDYINYLYNTVNQGERISYFWMKDALLSKVGFLKVWWDDRHEEKREDYEGLDEVELAQLMDDEEIEVTEQHSYPDEEDQEQRQEAIKQLTAQLQQAQQAANQGQPNPQAVQAAQAIVAQIENIKAQPPKMLFDVTCKRTMEGGKACVENVPPEEMLVSRRAKDIQSARFIGHRFLRTYSDLKSQGYKNLDQIGSDDTTSAALNMERIERYAWDDELAYMSDSAASTIDESQRQYWVVECYVRCDYDGDGISELRKVVRCGSAILENEIVDEAPFVAICPVPMPHKLFGLSVADLSMEGQKVNTSLLRATLDNTYLETNGRYYAVEGQVNLDDLLTSRPGGIVRVKQQGAVGALEQGRGNAGLSLQMLEYMKGYQEEATGWSRASQGNDPSGLRSDITATQSNQITNRADMRLDLIARNFATGFRDLYRMLLKLASQYQQREEVIQLRGEWVEFNPRDWRRGFEASINVGLGTGNKDQTVGMLRMLIEQQMLGMQDGTATPENLYQSRRELATVVGFKNADKFFTDPAKVPPKDPQPTPDVMVKTQADMQAKQMQLQQDAQHFQADMQLKMQAQQQAHDARMMEIQKQYELQASNDQRDAQREQMKASYDAQRAEAEAENARVIQAMKSELERYKADLDAQVKLTIAQQSAAPAVDVAPIQAALDQMIEHLAAPVEIIRAPDGKAMGVKRGAMVRQIQRGPDGRAMGVQ